MTPEERREVLAHEAGIGPVSADIASTLVESWLAERDAEIERLRNDLRETEAQVRDPESMERELDERLADERRRTAEEIKARVQPKRSSSLIKIAVDDVARICDEVGGSE